MSSDLIRESILGFYEKIGQAYHVLEQNRTQIEDRKTALLSLLQESIHFPAEPEGQGTYQNICREMLRNAKSQFESWQDAIHKQIERSEFVNRHEKSILALVFADVNAGKSTLGNFVSGYNLQGTSYDDLYQHPTFQVQDYSKASTESRSERVINCFVENAVEATSTIQYFTLSKGLTWVDTPGLHSLTAEHGDLAQEYLQFADLVIYLTPSSSPFKMDEREMLSDVFRRGKPVILATTKSDRTKKIENPDGTLSNKLIPKSAEDRSKQEVFIAQEVRSLGGEGLLKNSRFLSLSVRLAREAVKTGSAEVYQASNLDNFFIQIGELLSSEAMELKMQRPKAEVNDFIDRLTGVSAGLGDGIMAIAELQIILREQIKELDRLIEDSKKKKSVITAEIDKQLPLKLDLLYRDLRSRGEIENSETVRNETAEVAVELVTDLSRKHLKEIGTSVLSLRLPCLKLDNSLGEGYRKTEIRQKVVETRERAPKGLLEHIESFFAPNKKFTESVIKTESIPVGDNFSAYLSQQLDALSLGMSAYVDTSIQYMTEQCVQPLRTCYQQLDAQLEELVKKLNAQRF